MSKESRGVLNDRIEELKAVIEILTEIRDNPEVGEKKLCEKHGINFRRYRRYAYDAQWFDKSSNAAESEESTAERMQKIIPTLSWYERLWMDIMQMRYGDVDACPTQLEELLDYMMMKLTQRESDVIHYRYEEGMTLAAIGEILGVTDDRVRQIEAKALRKLRYSAGWLKVDKDHIISMLAIQKHLEDDIEIRTKHKVTQYLDSKLVSLKKIIDGCTKTAVKEYLNTHPDISIEDMDFTVRTFNCLKRANINTVDQLRQYTEEELAKVRNLGPSCVMEIKRKLDDMGIKLATESKTE